MKSKRTLSLVKGSSKRSGPNCGAATGSRAMISFIEFLSISCDRFTLVKYTYAEVGKDTLRAGQDIPRMG